MTPNEIMDMSIRAYQNLGLPILSATAVPSLFCLAAVVFGYEYALPGLGVTQSPDSIQTQLLEALGLLVLTLFVAGPLFMIGLSYSSALVTQMVSDFMQGNVPSVPAAHQTAKRHLWEIFRLTIVQLLMSTSAIITSFLLLMLSAWLDNNSPSDDSTAVAAAGFATFGFIAGIFICLFFLSRHSLAVAATIVEGFKPGRAMKRSTDLLKGTISQPSGYSALWSLYLVLFLVFLFVWVGISSIVGLFGVEGHLTDLLVQNGIHDIVLLAFRMLPVFLAIWVVIPIWATTTTILYYERRARLEGYDIEALAQDVWRTSRQSRFQL